MEEFGVREGVLITKKEEKEVKFKTGTIKLVPAWKWFLLN